MNEQTTHPRLRGSQLSGQQRRTLAAIARMEAAGEDGHDICGDLSICSGNSPATLYSLQRRGLIDSTFDEYAAEGEQWSYTLTDKGRQAIG